MRGIRARFLLAVVASLLFGWSSGASAVPVQWTVAEGGNDHWYDIKGDGFGEVAGAFLWGEAKADAEARGGYLATPTSAAEWVLHKGELHSHGMPAVNGKLGWLGGFQNTSSPSYSEPGGGWEWVTGEPWVFTAWSSGEPNQTGSENHLLTWFGEGGGWNDHYDSPFKYYIEYDSNPIPEPSTALLLGLGLAGMAASRRRVR